MEKFEFEKYDDVLPVPSSRLCDVLNFFSSTPAPVLFIHEKKNKFIFFLT